MLGIAAKQPTQARRDLQARGWLLRITGAKIDQTSFSEIPCLL